MCELLLLGQTSLLDNALTERASKASTLLHVAMEQWLADVAGVAAAGEKACSLH